MGMNQIKVVTAKIPDYYKKNIEEEITTQESQEQCENNILADPDPEANNK